MAATTATLGSVFAPAPQTKRGYGIQLHSATKTNQFLYCNGKNVIIRSLTDPSRCEIFSEHKCNVSVAKFSPNCEWVASGDSRGRVLIWGLKNKLIKAEVNVCRDVLDLAWSDDGKRIVAVGDGNGVFAKAFMWDSGSTVGDITNHSKSILSVDLRQKRPYRVATASEDRQINFYSGPPFRFDKMDDSHTRYPNQVRFSPDGEYFISVGSDKSILLFNGSSGDLVKDLAQTGAAPNAHQGSIWSFAWAPDSKHILTVSGDCTAKIWTVPEGNVIDTFIFPSDGTTCHQQVGCLWHDDQTLVSVSLSGAVNFLSRANPKQPKLVVKGHSVAISALAVDLSTRTVYSGDSIGSVYKWDPFSNAATELTNVGDGAKNISDLALGPNSTLYSAAYDDVLRANLAGEGCALSGQPVAIAAGSSDLVVVVTRKKQVIVAIGGKQIDCHNLTFTPTGVALAPDSQQVAISGAKSVALFSLDPTTFKLSPVKSLEKHTDNTAAVAYSPDGKLLCSSDGQRSVYVWDRSTGNVCNSSGWRYAAAKVTTVCFSPDSKSLATGSVDQSIIVYKDLVGFQPDRIKIDPAHVGGVSHARFIDNDHLVSTGDDRAVKLWNLA